jgi:hypothetical protein
MITQNPPRQFFRHQNNLRLYLDLKEWPVDVPLPPQTAIVGIGENNQTLIHPYWEFELAPTRTVETFGGWFRFPLKLAEGREWYLRELSALGWVEDEEEFRDTVKVSLHFEQPKTNLRLRLSLQWYESHNETWALVTRYAIHPYALPEETNGEPAAEQIALPIAEMAEA